MLRTQKYSVSCSRAHDFTRLLYVTSEGNIPHLQACKYHHRKVKTSPFKNGQTGDSVQATSQMECEVSQLESLLLNIHVWLVLLAKACQFSLQLCYFNVKETVIALQHMHQNQFLLQSELENQILCLATETGGKGGLTSSHISLLKLHPHSCSDIRPLKEVREINTAHCVQPDLTHTSHSLEKPLIDSNANREINLHVSLDLLWSHRELLG